MTATTKGPERTEHMVKVLRQWQAIERESINTMAEITETTENSFIRMIMEIIRHDSLMHHRVQQFLIDSVTRENVNVSREDVAEIWERIEAHDKVERKTIEMAKALKEEAISPIHKQLLDYLLTDESKHDSLIGQLEEMKKDMTRASGA